MNASDLVNLRTLQLAPYPMEALTRIRKGLEKQGKKVFDFGTGDPKIPTDERIRATLCEAVPKISQYPSVFGTEDLKKSHIHYLERRFNLKFDETMDVIPSSGSKEAIFHIALCLIGRAGGKKYLVYPDPGYPVYKSSAIFSGGIPYPVVVDEKNEHLLKPWTLPNEVQNQAAAVWINHPHNPTGALANLDYYRELVKWGHEKNCVILGDDCYVDIYDQKLKTLPPTLLQVTSDRVLVFMSLSKRSGLTGYRSGFIAGDKRIVAAIAEARANFGVASPRFVTDAATVAWLDDEHVAKRRKIFSERMDLAFGALRELELIEHKPQAAFYLWCRLPKKFKGRDDVEFCMKLAEEGIITSPSSWLSEGVKGYFRLALVPDIADISEAMTKIKKFVNSL